MFYNRTLQLMDVLSDESLSDIISWLPNGKGFVIKDKKRFADEILSKYFKKSKFTSFTRKLNRWNFVRVTRGPETGGEWVSSCPLYFTSALLLYGVRFLTQYMYT